jgi:hypothetical protein
MISLETAQKLKTAGLVWEPQQGDWYFSYGQTEWIISNMENFIESEKHILTNRLFRPRLDQLLTEIRNREWEFILMPLGIEIYQTDWQGEKSRRRDFYTRYEDATAEALIWVLHQGGS